MTTTRMGGIIAAGIYTWLFVAACVAAQEKPPEGENTNAPAVALFVDRERVRIGDELIVTVTNVPKALAEKLPDTNKVVLLLRDTSFRGLCNGAHWHATGVMRLQFGLMFGDENKKAWSKLLRSPEYRKDIPVNLILADGSELPVSSDKLPTVDLIAVEPNRVWLGRGLLVLFAYLFLYLAFRSDLIRDTVRPLPPRLEDLKERLIAATAAAAAPAGGAPAAAVPAGRHTVLADLSLKSVWAWLALVPLIAACAVLFLDADGKPFFWLVVGWCAFHLYARWIKPTTKSTDFSPFSLARTQMAIWFFLVICAWVFLWLVTGTLNTLTNTVLALIGIGAGTALGAEAQDAGKASHAEELQKKHEDLQREQQKRALTATEVIELNELPRQIQNAVLTYPPTSRRFLDDILTDDKGISFHRFQMFVWTVALAIVFVTEVRQNFVMPEFSTAMLALMGISSGTYLGFMIKETHSSRQSKEK